MIVLDTNVLSALMKPHAAQVHKWLDRQKRDAIWITSISILEGRSGILQLPLGRRRQAMTDAFDAVLERAIAGRILPFDETAAEAAAEIATRRIAVGLNIETLDTQIAGICVSRSATLATRNVRHFDDVGVPLINPWQA
jgi:predicted nucleic acid-binding protein